MPFTSSPRRALGLVAVSTIGLTTAVLGVTGVAQAEVPTWSATGSGPTDPVPADICAIEWTVFGGGAGLGSDGAPGIGAGVLYAEIPAEEGEVYTLFPGGAGSDGTAGTEGSFPLPPMPGVPGTGGTRADGDTDLEGGDGTADGMAAGGGGGAASTVELAGETVLQAYGSDADGDLGGLGGGEESFVLGANYSEEDVDTSGEPGEITGEGIPCMPASPYLNGAEGKDQALELDFVPGEGGDLPTSGFEYTQDDGDTWAPLTGITVRDGRSYGTISGLTNGTEYTVQIRAVAANGSASYPTQAVTATPYKKATAPSNVKVATGEGALTVTWGASTAGTYPITGYAVELVWSTGESGGGSEFCRTGPTVFTCTAPAQPGVTHDVVVYALDGGNSVNEWAKVTSGVVPASSVLPESDGDLQLPAGSTASVPAGKTITVSGSGYAPFSTVTVLIYSEPQILTTVVADANGDFTVTVTVPAGLAPGKHTLVASGVDSMGQLRFITLPVTVVAGLAYTGADIAVPAIGGLAALTAGGALIFVARRRTVS